MEMGSGRVRYGSGALTHTLLLQMFTGRGHHVHPAPLGGGPCHSLGPHRAAGRASPGAPEEHRLPARCPFPSPPPAPSSFLGAGR